MYVGIFMIVKVQFLDEDNVTKPPKYPRVIDFVNLMSFNYFQSSKYLLPHTSY